MKYYSTKKIKDYIEANKEKILTVECGMREDWSWTAMPVYCTTCQEDKKEYVKEYKKIWPYDENGYYSGIDWHSKYLYIAGINGSYWATPVMFVTFIDNSQEIIPCWEEDERSATSSEISDMMLYAKLSGGMDYLE